MRYVNAACVALLVTSACRLDPGTPDYSGHVGLFEPDGDTEPVDGPDPYEPGEARLAFGLFYEGGFSDVIASNGTTINYFIFVIEGTSQLTYAQEPSDDRVEGVVSDQITLEGTPFWGGGFVWNEPIDISEWTTMYVSFKSSDPSFETFDLQVQSGAGAAATNLDPRDYGYVNDGEWHNLAIPVQDFVAAGFDPTQTRSPFILASPGGDAGDVLLVDNLYYTQD